MPTVFAGGIDSRTESPILQSVFCFSYVCTHDKSANANEMSSVSHRFPKEEATCVLVNGQQIIPMQNRQ